MERKDFIEKVGLSSAAILIFGCMQSCSKEGSTNTEPIPPNTGGGGTTDNKIDITIVVMEEILMQNNQGKIIENLYYAGHSLGGGMASIGVYDFLNVLSFCLSLSSARITNLYSVNFVTSAGDPFITFPDIIIPRGSSPAITEY